MQNRNDNNRNNNNKPGGMPPNRPKKMQTVTMWIVIALIMAALWNIQPMIRKSQIKEVTYSTFMSMAKSGSIMEAQFVDRDVEYIDADSQKYHTLLPMYPDPDFMKELTSAGINVSSKKPSKMFAFLMNILPFLLIIGFWLFMMRSMQGGGRKAFSFGKSKAKLFLGGKTNITFKDVAGVKEAKEELEEIVEFLKSPSKFQKLGGRIPRGVLLLGRPGTGKTLLAKAVAGEAKVPFFSISGSDFVEMFVGVGASRVRDLFENAKKNSPCIAFIDEIDAVGRHRGSGLGGGHDEREQTLNQLLVEMDGFEANDSVIIIAATNRPDVLDPALLRPGRFDRQVVVDLPDIKGREAILKVHVKKLPLADSVNLSIVARGTSGFSGADLANLVNEAALLAARKNKKRIEMDDFEEAKDKQVLGKARKSKVISEEEKKNTSYHEVGHVLTSVFLDKVEPVHKVSIIPRGFTGGATHYLQTDKSSYSRSYLEQKLVSLLGGRCAEEIIFNELTTGAGNDIQRATDIVTKMVCHWGMSRKIGPMKVGKENEQVFLGKELTQSDYHSEKTAEIIDQEIRDIIHEAHEKAMAILTEHKELLEVLSMELYEKETMGATEIFDTVMKHVDDDMKEFIEKRRAIALEMVLSSEMHDEDIEAAAEETEEAEKTENIEVNETDDSKES